MESTADEELATGLRGQRRLAQLLNTFGNMVQSIYQGRTEKPLGLALVEWRVLRATILRHPISQAGVATGEGLNVMGVSRAVAGLRAKGLLECHSDPDDRRKTMLSPTDLGRQLGADMAERERVMYEHTFSVLSTDEQRLLDELLERVNGHLRDTDLPPPPTASRDWAALFEGVASNEETKTAHT